MHLNTSNIPIMSKKQSYSDCRFNGDSKNYEKFKDSFMAMLKVFDNGDYQRFLCEPKKHLEPKYKRIQILQGTSMAPPPGQGEEGFDPKTFTQYDGIVTELHSALNIVLPSNFSTEYKIHTQPPSTVWKDLERRYGTSTSVTLMEQVQRFFCQTPNYDNVDQLMGICRKQFNKLNTDFHALLGREESDPLPLPEELLAIQTLRSLPQEKAQLIPAQKPSDLKVETMFRNIKQMVQASHRDTRRVNHITGNKRKTPPSEEARPSGCYYCFEHGHSKHECKVRKTDRANLVYKKNVNSAPSKKPATQKQIEEARVSSVKASEVAGKQRKTEVNAVMGETSVLTTQDIEGIQLDDDEQEVIIQTYKHFPNNTNKLWLLDTGSGLSITGHGSLIRERNPSSPVILGSPLPGSHQVETRWSGQAQFSVEASKSSVNLTINKLYFAPGWENNIVSSYDFKQAGFIEVPTTTPKFLLYQKDGQLVMAKAINGVYYLNLKARTSHMVNYVNAVMHDKEMSYEKLLQEWHIKLGHINKQTLIVLLTNGTIKGIPRIPPSALKSIPFYCKSCLQSKHNRMSYKRKTGSRADTFFETIHSDTMKVETPGTFGGSKKIRYVQNFIDDHTSYKWIHLSQAINGATSRDNLRSLTARIKTKYGKTLKCLRTDNGSEYLNDQVQNYTNKEGILHERSNIECQEENGSSERYNQTLLNYARTMLIGAGIPIALWPEAASHANYLLNRLPTRRLGISPYEAVNGHTPDLSSIPTFGTTCYAHVPHKERPHKKLATRATRCRFLGVDPHHKDAYRLLNIDKHVVFVSRDVKFNYLSVDKLVERSFAPEEPLITSDELAAELRNELKNDLTGPAGATPTDPDAASNQNLASVMGEANTLSNLLDKLTDLINSRHKKRLKSSHDLTASKHGDVRANTASRPRPKPTSTPQTSQDQSRITKSQTSTSASHQGNITSSDHAVEARPKRKRNPSPQMLRNLASSITTYPIDPIDIDEPKTLKQALSSKDKEQWLASVKKEYTSLLENGTWRLEELPQDKKALRTKWVFRIKKHADGSIEKYKSRLVVKGFSQRPGVDFDEIFSPVIRIESLKLMLAIATILDMEIHQMDVATAFLNGDIDIKEPIYMRQPEGFHKGGQNQVCRLLKSLYGLKQAPRIWYQLLHKFLTSMSFQRCDKEYCIYVFKRDGLIAFIAVYVDDLTIICKDLTLLNKIKQDLKDRFKMTDLGEIHHLLQIKITRDRENKRLYMSQEKYILDLVKQYKLRSNDYKETPQALTVTLAADKNSKVMHKYPYASLVGGLQYLVRGTRPDIANAVRELARFSSCYNESHWKAALHVLKYLKHTSTFKFTLDGKDCPLEYHLYTDASFGCSNTNRKSVLGYCLIMANAAITHKSGQATQIHLSTSEAETAAAVEGIKESEWLFELFKELEIVQDKPVILYCDNNSAISHIKNPCKHYANKHLEIKQLYARQKYEQGRINVIYCPTDTMVADIFTKALGTDKFEYFRSKLGILP